MDARFAANIFRIRWTLQIGGIPQVESMRTEPNRRHSGCVATKYAIPMSLILSLSLSLTHLYVDRCRRNSEKLQYNTHLQQADQRKD